MSSSLSRMAMACAAASAMAVAGAHVASAAVITDPTGSVSVATGNDSANGSLVAVSTGPGCANTQIGVALSLTGCSWGGFAVSGTGNAISNGDLQPVAVSGTGEAAGCGDLGHYTITGTGPSEGCSGDISVAGYACGANSEVEISLLGRTCGSAPINFCGGCLVSTLTVDSWGVGQATRRS